MKYLLIFLSSFIVFVANADPLAKDVNATQAGEWNVNINGVPGVTIENESINPVPVIQSRPQRTPYNFYNFFTFRNTTSTDTKIASYDFTPSTDELLVIETVTFNVDIRPDEQLYNAIIGTTVNGKTSAHYLTIPEGIVVARKAYNIALPIRLYADPGTTISLSFAKNATLDGGTVAVSLSGYLIPAGDTSLAP